MTEEKATHYTLSEGGKWHEWQQKEYHSHYFPTAIRFDSGWVFDLITNSWRKENNANAS